MDNPLRDLLAEMLKRYKAELDDDDAVATLHKAAAKALFEVTGEEAPAQGSGRAAATKAKRARGVKKGATRSVETRAKMVASHAGVKWDELAKADQNAYIQYVQDKDAGDRDAKPPTVKPKAKKSRVQKAKAKKARAAKVEAAPAAQEAAKA